MRIDSNASRETPPHGFQKPPIERDVSPQQSCGALGTQRHLNRGFAALLPQGKSKTNNSRGGPRAIARAQSASWSLALSELHCSSGGKAKPRETTLWASGTCAQIFPSAGHVSEIRKHGKPHSCTWGGTDPSGCSTTVT